MKRRIFRIAGTLVVCLALTLTGCMSLGGSGGSGGRMTIKNSTGEVVWYAYISRGSSSSWGSDQLGNDETIANGASRTFVLPSPVEDQYDVRLIDRYGYRYERRNIVRDANSIVEITRSDSADNAVDWRSVTAMMPERDVELGNSYRRTITSGNVHIYGIRVPANISSVTAQTIGRVDTIIGAYDAENFAKMIADQSGISRLAWDDDGGYALNAMVTVRNFPSDRIVFFAVTIPNNADSTRASGEYLFRITGN